MKKITPQDIQKGVETVSASPESTYYITLDNLNNGDELCLAFGMGEGFDEPTVCAKIAVLAGNSAMSDYEWDFVMPYEAKSGSVWDTEVSNPGESDAEWFNTQAAQIARKLNSGKLVASACGKKKGKRKPVQSMARGYLQPQYDSRASFYNKAEFDDDKLYSYGTLVAEIVDGKPVLYPDWDYSQTTIRHVREFLRQHGFTADSKAQIAKDYLTNSRKPIQSMYVTEDISGNDLYTVLWSGGKDQFDSMIEDGADADDILNACEELLFREEGNPPTMTELNDLIWFDPDLIRDYIGLSNPIESGCHEKSKKKGKKKAVKSSMSVRDLPREALQELKERYYAEKYDQDLSYGELANIDDIVSDEEVFDEYDGTSFTEDDFFCLASSRKAVKSGLYDEAKDYDPNDYEWGKVYDFIWNKYSTQIDRALNDLLYNIQEELGITTGDTQLDSNVDDCIRKLVEVLTDQYGNRS
jgi:hypothetical protein